MVEQIKVEFTEGGFALSAKSSNSVDDGVEADVDLVVSVIEVGIFQEALDFLDDVHLPVVGFLALNKATVTLAPCFISALKMLRRTYSMALAVS